MSTKINELQHQAYSAQRNILQWHQYIIDMQKILRNGSVLTYSTFNPPCIAQAPRRFVSRNTAIHRGLRQGAAVASRDHRDHRDGPWEKKRGSWGDSDRPNQWEERPYQSRQDDRGARRPEREDSPLGFSSPEQPRLYGRKDRRGDGEKPSPTRSRSYDEPISIPYTTAASEFLYGYNPVCAALKAQRRKLYKIYLHPRIASRDGDEEVGTIRRLAEGANVEIKNVDDSWLKAMDKMSDDRPHNVSANTHPHSPIY
jgi:hypothetical protein